MQTERISTSRQLPAAGESIVFYSENTGVHRGIYDPSGTWRDIFDQTIERVTYWWPLYHLGFGQSAHR